jgi:hypothetical protein
MNDTMGLLLATTILSIGGVGLYMYKSDEVEKVRGEEEYNEDGLFGPGSFWGSSNETEEPAEVENYEEPQFYEPKIKTRGGKTKRNNRKTSGTKRRYY